MVADHDWPPGLARAIARTVISRLLRDQPIAILEQESSSERREGALPACPQRLAPRLRASSLTSIDLCPPYNF